MSLAEALLDLRRRQTFPGAEPSLAQARIEAHLEVELFRQDLRGLARPVQVARIDGVDGAVEGAGERSRLFAAEVVEARVRQALPAPFAVPVGLPVSNEQQSGHRHLGAARGAVFRTCGLRPRVRLN